MIKLPGEIYVMESLCSEDADPEKEFLYECFCTTFLDFLRTNTSQDTHKHLFLLLKELKLTLLFSCIIVFYILLLSA